LLLPLQQPQHQLGTDMKVNQHLMEKSKIWLSHQILSSAIQMLALLQFSAFVDVT
jgi:hypothetical protein